MAEDGIRRKVGTTQWKQKKRVRSSIEEKKRAQRHTHHDEPSQKPASLSSNSVALFVSHFRWQGYEKTRQRKVPRSPFAAHVSDQQWATSPSGGVQIIFLTSVMQTHSGLKRLPRYRSYATYFCLQTTLSWLCREGFVRNWARLPAPNLASALFRQQSLCRRNILIDGHYRVLKLNKISFC